MSCLVGVAIVTIVGLAFGGGIVWIVEHLPRRKRK